MDAESIYRFDEAVPNQKTQRQLMPMQTLGKVLFPRLQPWQQRQQAQTAVTVLVVAVVFAAIVGGIIFMSNGNR